MPTEQNSLKIKWTDVNYVGQGDACFVIVKWNKTCKN